MTHSTFTWSTIKNEIDRPRESAILKIIDFIISSSLSHYIYPATMHTNLRIGRSQNFSRIDGELTIEYNLESDIVTFKYYDSLNVKPWQKTCKGIDVISTFKYILIKRLHWLNKI